METQEKEISKRKDKKEEIVEIEEKIKINFEEEEREYIYDIALSSFCKFDLLESVFTELPSYQQEDIHADIKRRFVEMKLKKVTTSDILFRLINHYTPDGKEDNPQYTSIAQALVFFFFEDCTWGKKTEKELLGLN